jgi:hypothetical protein
MHDDYVSIRKGSSKLLGLRIVGSFLFLQANLCRQNWSRQLHIDLYEFDMAPVLSRARGGRRHIQLRTVALIYLRIP